MWLVRLERHQGQRVVHFMFGLAIDAGHDEVLFLRLVVIACLHIRSLASLLTLQQLQVVVVEQVDKCG